MSQLALTYAMSCLAGAAPPAHRAECGAADVLHPCGAAERGGRPLSAVLNARPAARRSPPIFLIVGYGKRGSPAFPYPRPLLMLMKGLYSIETIVLGLKCISNLLHNGKKELK